MSQCRKWRLFHFLHTFRCGFNIAFRHYRLMELDCLLLNLSILAYIVVRTVVSILCCVALFCLVEDGVTHCLVRAWFESLWHVTRLLQVRFRVPVHYWLYSGVWSSENRLSLWFAIFGARVTKRNIDIFWQCICKALVLFEFIGVVVVDNITGFRRVTIVSVSRSFILRFGTLL